MIQKYRIYKELIDGYEQTVKVCKRSNSKRISIKVNNKLKMFIVSIPNFVSYETGIQTFHQNYNWVSLHKFTKQQEEQYVGLESIKLAGELYKVVYIQSSKNKVKLDANTNVLAVEYIDAENINQIVEKFIKKHAKDFFIKVSEIKAKAINVKVNKVIISDSSTKWGSCSSAGNLRYNYRLIMAPLFVIDYLIAHEVAHLKEFNHSKAFWSVVEYLSPYTIQAKEWLKYNSKELY